jgi:hypothetical protein
MDSRRSAAVQEIRTIFRARAALILRLQGVQQTGDDEAAELRRSRK